MDTKPDRTFTFPIDCDKLETKEIEGEVWVPFMGQKITADLAEKRKRLGGFTELACREGWHVIYRPISCPSVKAMGWMSNYCRS